jgi:hypothetical protein
MIYLVVSLRGLFVLFGRDQSIALLFLLPSCVDTLLCFHVAVMLLSLIMKSASYVCFRCT